MSNKPFLTIGMAACCNFQQVKWTVTMLRMMHPEVMSRCEIIVCDNAPDTWHGRAMKKFMAGWVPNGRYFEANKVTGTAHPREQIFTHARGEWVLVIDSHVALPLGTLERFIKFAEDHPESCDLYQGPMLLDDLAPQVAATEMKPTWGAGMLGQWFTKPEATQLDAEPHEIELHGLGLFACRRDAWQHFNARFCGFGGEEGYIHEKFRRAGFKCWCLPFLRWWHDFRDDEDKPPYQLPTALRVRNYLIGSDEIEKPWTDVLAEFHGSLTAAEVLNLQMEFGDTREKWELLEALTDRSS